MSIKSFVAKRFARHKYKQFERDWSNAVACQEEWMHSLVKKASSTTFGKDHQFTDIKSYDDFKKNVPLRDYEGLRPYVDQILEGKKDVLWPGMPAYFAKTSGTTSGTKFIPISKDSMPNHINTARNALLTYVAQTGKTGFLNGKLIFLSGSPELEKNAGVLTGRLSGIVNHHVPSYLKNNQLPSLDTNMMDDWEAKVDKIVEETIDQSMSLISGIPPWVQMYFERLLEKSSKKSIKELFPDFNLFVYGGVNYEPYRVQLEKIIGDKVDAIETYPASEGFIAFGDVKEKGLLLNINSGIFFEFVEADKAHDATPPRVQLGDVEIGINYAIILNTNAGLWGYVIGDTVKFVSKDPYRLVVTGRTKHFISAFGEHVIGEEVDRSMVQVCQEHNAGVIEFTVAPQVAPTEGLPYHEWMVEFEKEPLDLHLFASRLDELLQEQNSYYKDLITGNVLKPLKLTRLKKNAFREYMKSQGKLGGQNKVPRLSDNRTIADALQTYIS